MARAVIRVQTTGQTSLFQKFMGKNFPICIAHSGHKTFPIPVTVPLSQKQPHHTQKGFLAQNFLTVVSYEFGFLCLLAGWKGSVHNVHVLANAF